jgi:hypothetical protein
MKQHVLILVGLLLTFAVGFAQSNSTIRGIIKSEDFLPQGTRVAIHVVNNDGVWGYEVGNVVPIAGTFSITALSVPEEALRPFRSGAVLLPGLQNEYRVSPDDVNYALGRVNMYVDNNANSLFDRGGIDTFFIGVLSLEEPVGFFSLLYVDKAATMTGSGVELALKPGWNIFSVRFPDDQGPAYRTQSLVEDVVLDVFLP